MTQTPFACPCGTTEWQIDTPKSGLHLICYRADCQTAALAGLAKMTWESGQWHGKARIQRGRRHLRHALFMPALVAMKRNPDLCAKYDALRAAGKPHKVAVTVLMRKLLILATTLLKQNRLWQPKPA
ncbi:transposase [Primorskyibacter aestuariivivens]|uniref:transposase n=1 Tax=Primorskyibacter aestuariivivens TaxID=1888912 RepID=UPI0022FFFAE6|nr:transposase [Primorskyibacter aestuariivivens]MDA7427088.1 transposase [Primorskyibacter aestuariivivens]